MVEANNQESRAGAGLEMTASGKSPPHISSELYLAVSNFLIGTRVSSDFLIGNKPILWLKRQVLIS